LNIKTEKCLTNAAGQVAKATTKVLLKNAVYFLFQKNPTELVFLTSRMCEKHFDERFITRADKLRRDDESILTLKDESP
jgi:hypothetical protein